MSPLPPEGQAWLPQSAGLCLGPRSAGLGWPLARRPQELVLPRPPAAGKRQAAPTLCLRPARHPEPLPPGPLGPGRFTQAGQHCLARTDGRSPGLTDEQSGT